MYPIVTELTEDVSLSGGYCVRYLAKREQLPQLLDQVWIIKNYIISGTYRGI